MRYTLMKKDNELLDFSYTKKQGIIIGDVLRQECLPYHMSFGEIHDNDLNDWILKRCISQSRSNIAKLLKFAEVTNVLELSFKNKGLCLTDSYWIKKQSDNSRWSNINFFENGYSHTVGDFLYKNSSDTFALSPDINTNGVMEKAWRRKLDKDYLFKLGKGPFYQEPYNEVICSEIAKAFPILKAVKYYLSDIENRPCSVCENFLTKDTEFVPASHLLKRTIMKDNPYKQLIATAKLLNIHGVRKFIDNMIIYDYLICNSDRHLGNFGFIRDSNTGCFLGMAPLFDNGNSLWHDQSTEYMNGINEPCKPFSNFHEEQILCIKSFDGVNLRELNQMDDFIFEKLKEPIGEERAGKISLLFKQRVFDLEKIRENIAHKHIRELTQQYNDYEY